MKEAARDAARKELVMNQPHDTPDEFADLDALEERQANPPRLWAPKGVPDGKEPADCVVTESVRGIVEEIDVRLGDYGYYRVLTLVQRDRSRVQVFGFGTILGKRFRTMQVGDAVGVAYNGTRPSTKTGMKDYDDFDVIHLRGGRPVTTGEVAEETDEDGSIESETDQDPAAWPDGEEAS